MIPLLGAAVARLGAQAVKEGSEARRLVRGIADSVRAVAGENPEFMQEVVVPLVEAGREALAKAEAEAITEGGRGVMQGATGSGDLRGDDRGEGAMAGARVMREIIRTPAFLEIIKTNMTMLDPEGARMAVRTILWEDPELTLSLAGTAPDVINYLVEAVLELGRQLNQFPAPLLDAFLDQLMTGVNTEGMREVPAVYGPLLEKIDAGQRVRVAAGAIINALARAINRASAGNPYFVRDSMPAIDGKEVGRAAFAVVRSTALWCISGLANLLKRIF